MNQGPGAGRDDDDLPLVDVVVPDDARELARDVLAYHRELRALRHRARWRRIARPVLGQGTALPLAVGVLLFALVAGAILSMLSSAPFLNPVGGPTAIGSAPTSLPDGALTVNGQQIQLRDLRTAVLALIPAGCGCENLLQRLSDQSVQAHVPLYLVEPTTSSGPAISTGGPIRAIVATDPANALGSRFHTAGLTVLLVSANGAVSVRRDISSGFMLIGAMSALGRRG